MRPVREQLEHDRVIRLLQAKYRRKFEVSINLSNQQAMSVPIGQLPWYPDLILQASGRGRKVVGVVEVETAESVNRVEAMSEWAAFSRFRGAFHLYVPQSMVDVARQLCGDLQIPVTEVWAFTAVGDQLRFTLVQRSARSSEDKPRAVAAGSAAGRRAPAAGRARVKKPAAARPARRAGAAAVSARRTPAKAAPRSPKARKKASRSPRAQKRK